MIQQKLDIDLTQADSKQIGDPRLCAMVLNKLAIFIDMKPVGSPIIYCYPLDHSGGGVGVTVFQPIAESYIAMDTYPEKRHANFHIYSCKEFNDAQVMVFIKKHFEGIIDINYQSKKEI